MNRHSGIFWGLILVLFGATFLLGNLGYVDFTLGRLVADFWPVVLIYIGARMVSTTYGAKAGSTVTPSLSGDAVTLAPGHHRLSARYLLGDLVVKPEGRIEGGALQIGLGNLEVDLRMSGPRTGRHTLECITRVGASSCTPSQGLRVQGRSVLYGRRRCGWRREQRRHCERSHDHDTRL